MVVSNIFIFTPLFREMIQFDYIIFFRWVETTNQIKMSWDQDIQHPTFRHQKLRRVVYVWWFVCFCWLYFYCPSHSREKIKWIKWPHSKWFPPAKKSIQKWMRSSTGGTIASREDWAGFSLGFFADSSPHVRSGICASAWCGNVESFTLSQSTQVTGEIELSFRM